MMRTILHIDMDAYYSSVEQHDRPELKGQPVIVGGTGACGVVSTASYDVRRFGVHSDMRMRMALQRCPQAVCIQPRIHRYQEVSRRIFAIFHEVTPLVEGVALDEAYLDITERLSSHGSAEQLGSSVKRRIRDVTGLTASVGLATNKLLAKIASDLEKPDGFVTLRPAEVAARLDPLPVRRLHGIGAKTAVLLRERGIETFRQLRLAPDGALWPLFGRFTQRMRDRAAGIDRRPVVANADCKSVSAGATFTEDIRDPARLYAKLMRLTDKIGARLHAKELRAAQVHIKIRCHDFTTYTRQHSFAPPTQDCGLIHNIACRLLNQWLHTQPHTAIRLLGVGVGALSRPAPQFDLFPLSSTCRQDPLGRAIDQIHEQFGTLSIARASGRRL